jgi:hypothetical protein
MTRRTAGLTLVALLLSSALFAAGVFAGRPDLMSRDGVERILARLGVASPAAATEGFSSRTLESALMPLRMEAQKGSVWSRVSQQHQIYRIDGTNSVICMVQV